MVLHADSKDVAEHWIIVVLRKAGPIRGLEIVEILKDELARTIFLESSEVDPVIRFTGWREGSQVESVVWLAAGVCHWGSVSDGFGKNG